MPTAGKPGLPFIYNEIMVEDDQILMYRDNALISDLYVTWAGHFENVNNNHAINRTLNYHLILYITDGQGYLEINGKNHVIRPGNILYISRDVLHTYGNQQGAWWSGYWSLFTGDACDRLVRQFFSHRYELFAVGLDDGLITIFEDILKQLRIGNEMQNVLHASNAMRYLLSMIFQLRRREDADMDAADLLEDVLHFMYSNLTKPVNLSTVAEYAHLSKSQMVRFFKQQTGFTPMQYYNLARMREACNKMLHGERNIHAIAMSLGFENQYYFSTMFKRTFGYSPTQFIRGTQKTVNRDVCPLPDKD